MYNTQTIKDHLKRQFNLPIEQIELMLPSFIDTIDSHMAKLQEAWTKGDLVLLGRAGHTIKGAFLNLGLDECAQIALRIEERGKAGDPSEDYNKLIHQLIVKVGPVLESKG